MAARKKTRAEEIAQEQGYVAFLEKRLASAHYRQNVPAAEVRQTQEKLKKARFRLRALQARG